MVHIRHYGYRVGQGIASDYGPPVGLAWYHDPELDDHLTIDEAEDLAEKCNRIPFTYFGGEGRLTPEDRIRKLREAGHRRCSIDLSTHQAQKISNSRRINSLLPGGTLIIDGMDPHEAMEEDALQQAIVLIRPIVTNWLQRTAKSSSSPFVFMKFQKSARKLEAETRKYEAGIKGGGH